MTMMVELSGRVPAGPLTVADMDRIDLDVPFEISDGKLEIMAPPTPWHQNAVDEVRQVLQQRYPYTSSDVVLEVGNNGRRPDAVALTLSKVEVLRSRVRSYRLDIVGVAVEIISHDDDKQRDKVAVARDREVKFHEYAEAGIPEYWLVDEVPHDPEDASVEIYHRRDGHYVAVAVVRLSKLLSGEVEVPPRQS